MAKLTTSDLASVNAAFWATMKFKINLQKGPFIFKGREYLREPMESKFRRRSYMKGSQGGGSTVEILKSFHGMIYNYLPTGVLYLFPTTSNMQDYSKAVMAPLIAANRHSIGKYVKNIKGASDAASLKSIGTANFFMRGGGLSKIIEGEGESDALKGISVDKVVFDEIELMEPETIAKAVGRLANSEVKEEIYIGNPGIPDRGIDEIFSLSDQRHWFRKCGCGEWTCAEESFPECIKIRPDGTGYIGCMKCGERVYVRDGQWVSKYPEKSSYMHGYRWSHLTSPNNDPAEVLEDFLNPPYDNMADVYRLRLGLPYVSSEDKLTIGQVLSRCGRKEMSVSDPGPCSFGLDVGKICHLVIGKRIGKETLEIVKVARLPGDGDWHEISEMITRFNCKSGVIDIRPYEASARRFQRKHKMRIFLCEYSETTPIGTVYNPKTGIVKVNRTEICDATHDLVADDGKLILPAAHYSEIKQFAKEVCDPAKSLEINKKTKISVYRYKGKEDHYRHALNYFLLATHKTARADNRSKNKKHRKVMNNYARI